MGKLVEEKALEHGPDSLEEQVSVFLDGHSDRSSHENDDSDGCESDGSLSRDPLERTIYWESQESLLQEILERYLLTGSKLRQEICRVIEVAKGADFCSCSKPSSDGHGCTSCLRRRVVSLLCDKGFNASLCISKWKHTKKRPGGSHEYIEVLASTQGRKKQIPLLIELEFRDQFRIAKACDEYCKLVAQLPEYYIGKADYLNTMVRILCDAAKTSMKEKKLHMGPWRKKSFMQMKWSSPSERGLSWDGSSNNKFSSLSSRQSHGFYLPLSAAHAVAVT